MFKNLTGGEIIVLAAVAVLLYPLGPILSLLMLIAINQEKNHGQ